jgi:hypothetical protein
MPCAKAIDLFGKTTECNLAEIVNRASLRDDEGNNHMTIFQVSGQRYPLMVVYFKGERAVVTYIKDEGSGVQLLTSDSPDRENGEVDFLSPFEGYDTFTEDFIVTSATAVKFLEAFVTGAPWPELPFWEDM